MAPGPCCLRAVRSDGYDNFLKRVRYYVPQASRPSIPWRRLHESVRLRDRSCFPSQEF